MQPTSLDLWHGTTILTVRKGGSVVIGGDGQVSIGQTVAKSDAVKVRKLRPTPDHTVLVGFAGSAADVPYPHPINAMATIVRMTESTPVAAIGYFVGISALGIVLLISGTFPSYSHVYVKNVPSTRLV